MEDTSFSANASQAANGQFVYAWIRFARVRSEFLNPLSFLRCEKGAETGRKFLRYAAIGFNLDNVGNPVKYRRLYGDKMNWKLRYASNSKR
jgi:hypothetical protein